MWKFCELSSVLQSTRCALSKIQLTKKCIRSLLIDDCSCLTVSPSLHRSIPPENDREKFFSQQ